MIRDAKARRIIFDISKKIEKGYRPEKIILYGSFAYGKPGRDSDIDFLIVKQTKERPIDRRVRVRRIVDVRETISFSPIVMTPREIENRLNYGDQALKEILDKGDVLYAA